MTLKKWVGALNFSQSSEPRLRWEKEEPWPLVQRWLCEATSLQTVGAMGKGCYLLKANFSGITTLDMLQNPFVLGAHGFLMRNAEQGLLSLCST